MTWTIHYRGLSLKKKGLPFLRRRVEYKRPWALYHDGVPVGFYVTADDARAACPVVADVEVKR
jgi:hypothetical protein